MLIEFISTEVQNCNNFEALQPALDLAKLYIAEKALANPDTAIAEAEKQMMVAITIWGRMVLTIKINLNACKKDGLRPDQVGEAAYTLLISHITALHHKQAGKHTGFQADTQACLNNITGWLSELEEGDNGVRQFFAQFDYTTIQPNRVICRSTVEYKS